MSDLVTFLLARIAEDEAPSWTLVPYRCEPDCCAPAGWVGRRCHICDDGEIFGGTVEAITEVAEEHAESIHQRSRVLAECESKRRILRRCHESNGYWGYDIERALALPYADHPEFRAEEWA